MSFTLGCDPELGLRQNGCSISADRYFKSNSSCGIDGNGYSFELRPGYAESVIDLTAKIHYCLQYAADKAPDLEFISGHFVDEYPISGHIHLSLQPDPEIVDALDTVLYALSNCIDDKEQRQKRERTGYGRRKATRKKSYGFEYRTPGSWLLSPSTTLVNFTLAKLAVIGVQEYHIDFT